jgi:nucleotide-binding universal stress UspA family protein
MLDSSRDRWIHPAAILVATDLSDLDRLMPFALQQAEEASARLFLLHVVPSTGAMAVDVAGTPYYDQGMSFDNATHVLEPWCERARSRKIRCDALVREGNPAQQVGVVIRQFHVDLLVLGTRSRSRLGKLLMGSVAAQLLRSVDLPVMTIGPEAYLNRENLTPVVLHATTLTKSALPSTRLACQVALRQAARLVLLHVLPPLGDPGSAGAGGNSQAASLDDAAFHQLRVLAAETASVCCTAIDTHVVHGNPPIEILAQAAESHASLIVLGATESYVFENFTRDRTIYKVLAHARCPVLTLRAPTEAPVAIGEPSDAAHR